MPPTIPGSANYYVVLNGAPNGPHRAAAVLQLLQEGSILPATLICADGGAAWVPVSEMEAALRLEAMPVPPPVAATMPPLPSAGPTRPVATGYGGGGNAGGRSSPAPRYQSAPAVEPPVSRVPPPDMTKPLRFATLLGALVVFFLPWVELRCSDLPSVRQTGVQTVLSRYSMDETTLAKMGDMARTYGSGQVPPEQLAIFDDKRLADEQKSELGYAWFAGGAMLFVVIGLGAALGPNGRNSAGLMALLALICLGMQMFAGFPLHREVEKRMDESIKQHQMTGAQAAAMREKLKERKFVAAEYTPWFYTELGLLALTAAIGLTGGARRYT